MVVALAAAASLTGLATFSLATSIFTSAGERAGIHLLAAVNAHGVPCARCADTSRGIGDLVALHMGVYDLVMTDRALLEVHGGISRVRRPVAEGMICKLHITACAASGMLAVVPWCPFAEGMLMNYIRADAVIRLGVGKDGQIDGAVCKQLILGDGNGDGSSGGRRGRTADGDNQFPE